jgi:hypothetical protein
MPPCLSVSLVRHPMLVEKRMSKCVGLVGFLSLLVLSAVTAVDGALSGGSVPSHFVEFDIFPNLYCSGTPSTSTVSPQGACAPFLNGLFAQYRCEQRRNFSDEGAYCLVAVAAQAGSNCSNVTGLDGGVCGFCYPRSPGSYEVISGCPEGRPTLHHHCNDSSCKHCAESLPLSMGLCFELTPDWYSFGGAHPCGTVAVIDVFADHHCTHKLEQLAVPANQCFNGNAVVCPFV